MVTLLKKSNRNVGVELDDYMNITLLNTDKDFGVCLGEPSGNC